METFDVAVVVFARVPGASEKDAAELLKQTIGVEIGTPGGPAKRAIGVTTPGRDAFIQVAAVEDLETAGAEFMITLRQHPDMYLTLESVKRDVS